MFYVFHQNARGGSLDLSGIVTHFMVVECDSAIEANYHAENGLGIRFNDGDRWSKAQDKDSCNTPLISGQEPAKYHDALVGKGKVYCRIFHKNGRLEEFKVQ